MQKLLILLFTNSNIFRLHYLYNATMIIYTNESCYYSTIYHDEGKYYTREQLHRLLSRDNF